MKWKTSIAEARSSLCLLVTSIRLSISYGWSNKLIRVTESALDDHTIDSIWRLRTNRNCHRCFAPLKYSRRLSAWHTWSERYCCVHPSWSSALPSMIHGPEIVFKQWIIVPVIFHLTHSSSELNRCLRDVCDDGRTCWSRWHERPSIRWTSYTTALWSRRRRTAVRCEYDWINGRRLACKAGNTRLKCRVSFSIVHCLSIARWSSGFLYRSYSLRSSYHINGTSFRGASGIWKNRWWQFSSNGVDRQTRVTCLIVLSLAHLTTPFIQIDGDFVSPQWLFEYFSLQKKRIFSCFCFFSKTNKGRERDDFTSVLIASKRTSRKELLVYSLTDIHIRHIFFRTEKTLVQND